MPTKIEWTEETWEVTGGCTKASDGCTNCYALPWIRRFASNPIFKRRYEGLVCEGNWTGKIKLFEDRLAQPLHWKTPRTIFVDPRSDLFHESVPFEFIDKVKAVAALCYEHTLQFLTKRADVMLKYYTEHFDIYNIAGIAANMVEDGDFFHDKILDDFKRAGNVFPNVWLGVTAENQEMWDKRYPVLRRLAGMGWDHFVSIEPMLSGIEISWCEGKTPKTWRCLKCGWQGKDEDLTGGNLSFDCPECDASNTFSASHINELGPIDYYPKPKVIICGGESGFGARPMHPGHARDLRDQCKAAGVPFFFKQWGKHLPESQYESMDENTWRAIDGDGIQPALCGLGDLKTWPLGKKRAGSLLDGVEHKEMPK